MTLATAKSVVLDVDRLVARRIELRLSQAQLARAIGRRGQVIARLEQGLSHEGVTLGLLRRLADVLGLEPEDLLAGSPPPSGSATPGLLARLGALLSAMDEPAPLEAAAAVLNVTLDELRATGCLLDERVKVYGMAVCISAGRISLTSAGGGGDDDLAALRRSALMGRAPDAEDIRILMDVVRGKWQAGPDVTRPNGMRLARLVQGGALRFVDAPGQARRPRLASDVCFSLMIDGEGVDQTESG